MKPKLLIVAPYPVFPLSYGGKIRTASLALELARSGVDVTILAPYMPGQARHRRPELKLKQVPYPFLAPLLFTDRPFPYQYLVSIHPGYGLGLRRFLRGFDAVQFEHISFADLLPLIPSHVPIFLNAHNVECDYIAGECRHPLVRRIAVNRTRSLEKRLLDAAARVFTCSEEQSQRFQSLYGDLDGRLVVIPNGIRTVEPPSGTLPGTGEFPALARFPRRAIFSGSDVDHNRRAVSFVLEELAPRFRERIAFVVHGGCGRRFRGQSQANVFFDPAFDGFARYSHRGFIGLNPVTTGSGTNLKLLHYLAHGLQVVTTPFGMRGLASLDPYVSVGEVEQFPAILESDPRKPPLPPEALEPFLWRNVAARLKAEIDPRMALRESAPSACEAATPHPY